jgi:hypothetical protein
MTPEISTTASMEVHFSAEERCLRHVRLSIVSFIMVMTENRDLASRVAMSAAELVENAVKYATSPKVVFRLVAKIVDGAAVVRLETENDARAEMVDSVQRIVEDVGRGDGMDAYLRFVRAVPEQSINASQLGLARIRFEGQMDLQAEIQGQRVRLIANSVPTRTHIEAA